LVSFFHTTSFRDIEDNFVGKREIAAAALTVCATLLLYLVQYELGSEGPFSSSAYILNCNSTTKKEKKSTKNNCWYRSSSSGIIVPIAISKS